MRAVVITCARPLVGPFAAAAITFVMVAKPGHFSALFRLRSQTIVPARDEIEDIRGLVELEAVDGFSALRADCSDRDH